MTRLSNWSLRHFIFVSVFSILLAWVGAYFSFLLYKNLRPNLDELLPKTARSVSDLEKVTGRLQSTSNLAVLVFSKNPQASKRFINDLAHELEHSSREIVARVEYRIDQEINFFLKRRALFLNVPDLKVIRNYIEARINYERELRNPLTIFREEFIPEPKLDISTLLSKYSSKVSGIAQFPEGYYANRDESIRVLLVYMAGKASDITHAKLLREEIDNAILKHPPVNYSPDIKIEFTGDAENLIEENASLMADLELSAAIVILLVGIALLVYYRDFLSTLALISSIFVGTLVTFGVCFFIVGYLNANSAFLGSIVLGNGINFGIIFLARYLEERRKKENHTRAIEVASSTTFPATLTASFAAGLSYGSLIITDFRGFRQFAIIGAIGMVICWLSAFTTLPAFLTLIQKFNAQYGTRLAPSTHSFGNLIAWTHRKLSPYIIGFSVVCLLLSLIVAFRYHGDLIEPDTSKLRDKTSMTQGSGFLSRYLDQIFKKYTSPIVILPGDLNITRTIESQLKALHISEGKNSLIAGVYTMNDFVPENQAEKISILRDIQFLLPARTLARLDPKNRDLIKSFLTPEALSPFGVTDLPEGVRIKFREIDGREGRLVLVEPVFDQKVLANAENQARFVSQIRQIVDSISPGTPVVGQLPLTVDMYQAVKKDGPKATVGAFVLVVLMVVILFREVRTVSYIISSLLLGVSWLFGIILLADYRINFLNFIALPITFGIGVDYSTNIIQRYRSERSKSILDAVKYTGGAVTLASITTIIGYGSLLIAGNQGFVSFGRIAVIGEITCLFAALFSIPAIIYLQDQSKNHKPLSQPLPEVTIGRKSA